MTPHYCWMSAVNPCSCHWTQGRKLFKCTGEQNILLSARVNASFLPASTTSRFSSDNQNVHSSDAPENRGAHFMMSRSWSFTPPHLFYGPLNSYSHILGPDGPRPCWELNPHYVLLSLSYIADYALKVCLVGFEITQWVAFCHCGPFLGCLRQTVADPPGSFSKKEMLHKILFLSRKVQEPSDPTGRPSLGHLDDTTSYTTENVTLLLFFLSICLLIWPVPTRSFHHLNPDAVCLGKRNLTW